MSSQEDKLRDPLQQNPPAAPGSGHKNHSTAKLLSSTQLSKMKKGVDKKNLAFKNHKKKETSSIKLENRGEFG